MSKRSSHIDISERKLLLRSIDVVVIILSLWISSTYSDFEYVDAKNTMFYQWLITLSFYFLLFGEIFQLYDLKVSNNRFSVVRSIVLTTFVTTLLYVFSPYITPSLPENRLQIIYFFLLIVIPVIIWRFLYMWVLFSPKFFKTIIIIGHNSKAENLLKLVHSNFNDVKTTNLSKLIDENLVTELVISTAGFSSETIQNLNKQLIQLFEEGVNIKSFETYYEDATNRVPKEYLDHNFYKNINFSKNNDSQFYLFIHRIIDLTVSCFGLLAFVLLFPFILIGNLIGNRGPIFYSQERVGHHGKTFKIVKLRSMIPNAEKSGAVWAQKNDKRITAFGKFLRNTRFDEIPQFYNIIKGDMSLIGPRPERPKFVNELEENIPFYAIRHVVRPGLTGWSQVNYPYASTMEEQETKLRYDLYYIKERSSFLDFKILIKTVTTVLFFKGQ